MVMSPRDPVVPVTLDWNVGVLATGFELEGHGTVSLWLHSPGRSGQRGLGPFGEEEKALLPRVV